MSGNKYIPLKHKIKMLDLSKKIPLSPQCIKHKHIHIPTHSTSTSVGIPLMEISGNGIFQPRIWFFVWHVEVHAGRMGWTQANIPHSVLEPICGCSQTWDNLYSPASSLIWSALPRCQIHAGSSQKHKRSRKRITPFSLLFLLLRGRYLCTAQSRPQCGPSLHYFPWWLCPTCVWSPLTRGDPDLWAPQHPKLIPINWSKRTDR